MEKEYWLIAPLEDEGGGYSQNVAFETVELRIAKKELRKARKEEREERKRYTGLENPAGLGEYGGFIPFLVEVKRL